MLLKTCKTWLLLSLCLVNTGIKLWLESTLICCWEYLIMKYTVWFKNSMKLKFYCIMTAFIVNFLPVAILFTRIKTWSSPAPVLDQPMSQCSSMSSPAWSQTFPRSSWEHLAGLLLSASNESSEIDARKHSLLCSRTENQEFCQRIYIVDFIILETLKIHCNMSFRFMAWGVQGIFLPSPLLFLHCSARAVVFMVIT